MRVIKPLLMMICLGVLICSTPHGVQADEWNKATSLTFSAPVEIPGMVLAPGTYVFKLLDSPAERSVVQIFNSDESHLYEDVLAIPAYRSEPTDKTVVTFEERAEGSPQAIKDWFYPGDYHGQEFVYPKVTARAVASLTPQEPIAKSNVLPEERLKPAAPEAAAAPEPAVSAPAAEAPAVTNPAPTNEPEQIAQATPAEPATPSTVKPAPQPQAQLPKTASPVPVLILIGLLSLGTSAGVYVFSKHSA